MADAYDRISGEPGAADRIIESRREGVSPIMALTEAFAALPAPAPRWNGPENYVPLAKPEPKPETKLNQYRALLAAGEARKAGWFYKDNREQIMRDMGDEAEEFARAEEARWKK